MAKIKLFVCSFSLPTVGFVDKEGAVHACARAQKTAFEGLARVSGIVGNRHLCDDDYKALGRVKEFGDSRGLEFEVVDVAALSFLGKLRLRMKGVRTPAIAYKDRIFTGVPTKEDLKKIIRG